MAFFSWMVAVGVGVVLAVGQVLFLGSDVRFCLQIMMKVKILNSTKTRYNKLFRKPLLCVAVTNDDL